MKVLVATPLARAGELHNLTEGDFQSLLLASDALADSFPLLKLRLWTVACAEPTPLQLSFFFFLPTGVEECEGDTDVIMTKKRTFRGLTLSERLQLQGGAVGAVVYRRRRRG